MKTTQFDGLYEIFEEHLFNALIEEDEDIFVCSVVDKYIVHLKDMASLPLHFVDEIKEDTVEEVHQMLLKKIYGHYDINHFRNSLKNM